MWLNLIENLIIQYCFLLACTLGVFQVMKSYWEVSETQSSAVAIKRTLLEDLTQADHGFHKKCAPNKTRNQLSTQIWDGYTLFSLSSTFHGSRII